MLIMRMRTMPGLLGLRGGDTWLVIGFRFVLRPVGEITPWGSAPGVVVAVFGTGRRPPGEAGPWSTPPSGTVVACTRGGSATFVPSTPTPGSDAL